MSFPSSQGWQESRAAPQPWPGLCLFSRGAAASGPHMKHPRARQHGCCAGALGEPGLARCDGIYCSASPRAVGGSGVPQSCWGPQRELPQGLADFSQDVSHLGSGSWPGSTEL